MCPVSAAVDQHGATTSYENLIVTRVHSLPSTQSAHNNTRLVPTATRRPRATTATATLAATRILWRHTRHTKQHTRHDSAEEGERQRHQYEAMGVAIESTSRHVRFAG